MTPYGKRNTIKILTQQNAGTLTLSIDGRIDTITVPMLEGELKHAVTDAVQSLVLDFAQVAYISSAGLRVLLAAQKALKRQGQMILRNVNETVMDVFEVTGFADILTFEQD